VIDFLFLLYCNLLDINLLLLWHVGNIKENDSSENLDEAKVAMCKSEAKDLMIASRIVNFVSIEHQVQSLSQVNEMIHLLLYKTIICTTSVETGFCQFGERKKKEAGPGARHIKLHSRHPLTLS